MIEPPDTHQAAMICIATHCWDSYTMGVFQAAKFTGNQTAASHCIGSMARKGQLLN